MPRQEDDIANALAELWRPVTTVIAVGASQNSLFYYTLDKRRKSPDLVAFSGTTLLVCECKVRASGLFAGGEESDAAHLSRLLGDRANHDDFCRRITDLAHSLGGDIGPDPVIVGILVAGTMFSDDQRSAARGLVCIEVDDADEAIVVEGSEMLPEACMTALRRPMIGRA